MKNKNLLLVGLLLCFVLQWAVPLSAIFKRNAVLDSGVVYRFRTAPVDPRDPFRGKFVALNFKDTELEVTAGSVDPGTSQAFVSIGKDSLGFAVPTGISLERPHSGDYLWCDVFLDERNKLVSIFYPFDRFYMNEYRAGRAEQVYNESNSNLKSMTWAEVSILEGQFVLEDVKIDGRSIIELAREIEHNESTLE